MENYLEKYLKYKSKYLYLKNLNSNNKLIQNKLIQNKLIQNGGACSTGSHTHTFGAPDAGGWKTCSNCGCKQ